MAATVIFTKVTAKGQITIPAKVRAHLGVKPGEWVTFNIDGDRVTLKRIDKLDAGYLKLATESFCDWNTPEADEAFRDL